MKRSIVVFSFLLCDLASYGFGQVQIDEVLNPTGEVIGRLKTAPDGRLWVFTRPLTIHQTPGPGTLLAQIAAAPTAPLQKVAENIDGNSFDSQGFFPGNGDSTVLSPTVFSPLGAGFKNLDVQASITPAGVQSLCSDYVATGGKTLLQYSLGSFPASDGSRYVVNTDYVASSTISLRGKPDAKSVCGLSSITTLNVPVLQAWKQADGSFLTQVQISKYDLQGSHSEIAIAHGDGSLSRLVSTIPANKPGIVAGACCDLVSDWSRDQSLVTHMGTNGDGGHAFLYKRGVNVPIYDNDGEGLVNDRIWGYDINGNWAVVGGYSSVDGSKGFRLILINALTRRRWVLAQTSGDAPTLQNPLYHLPSAVSVGPDGTVYFAVSDFPGKIFRATIPGVTGVIPVPTIVSFTADNPAIVAGGSVKLTWATTDATSATLDQGIGTVPLSGNVTVTPTQTTPYTLRATGPGGITSSTITITVTPRVFPPTISDGGVVNAASFDPKLSPGGYASIFGANLSDSKVVASLPYPTNVAGVQVLINGSPAPVQYVSAGQVNFLLPYDVKAGAGTVQVVRNGLAGNTAAVTITAVAPGVFANGNLGIVTDSAGGLVTAGNPIIAGTPYVLWLTGLGRTDCPTLQAGVAPNTICNALVQPQLVIDGKTAQIYYAGLSPQFPGLYQINFVVPGQANSSSSPLEVQGVVLAGGTQARFMTVSQQIDQ